MYQYDAFDRRFVSERVAQYRDQLERFQAGRLSAEEFLPLRLQNGWYVQRHAPMLRISVPYGEVSSTQLRRLARIARVHDRGFAHITTRQNVQFNWIPLERSADVLAELAEVSMHGMQTSGNCVRNITSDAFAGIAPDELADPRPFCEILRQWSAVNAEFLFLPRKFKVAITGAQEDRAATYWHDLAFHLVRSATGELGFRVLAGGGMGRTPVLASVVREFLPWRHLLTYTESILRVYNRHGRRDNKYKARIKILLRGLGLEEFRRQVEEDWQSLQDSPHVITDMELARVHAHFTTPDFPNKPPRHSGTIQGRDAERFSQWRQRNVMAHRMHGYSAVVLSLKRLGKPPGDITADELDAVAELSDEFSFGEARFMHEQNLLLPWVREMDLPALWQRARALNVANANHGLITDIICCPGGDLCALANARSIPIAESLMQRFDDLDYVHDLGNLDLHISGCINSCGHHHSGHIGVLGVDKDGAEWYQITLGGADGSATSGHVTSVGRVIGPSFAAEQVPDVVTALIDVYVNARHEGESFLEVVRRIGLEPFKQTVYARIPRSEALEEAL